jgi:hypothetical protein
MAFIPSVPNPVRDFDISLVQSDVRIVHQVHVPERHADVVVLEHESESVARGVHKDMCEIFGTDAQIAYFERHSAWRVWGVLKLCDCCKPH